MSDHTTIGRFCKCGDLHHLSRRFHGMGATGKREALYLIAAGVEPAKAIGQAKRFEKKLTATCQPEFVWQ